MEVTSPSSSCSTEPAREVTDTKQPTCRATSSWISWHMVYNINHRGVPCLESLRLQLEQMITKYNKCNKSEAWPRDELHGAGGSSPLEFIWISILVGRRNQHEPTITTHIQNCSLEDQTTPIVHTNSKLKSERMVVVSSFTDGTLVLTVVQLYFLAQRAQPKAAVTKCSIFM